MSATASETVLFEHGMKVMPPACTAASHFNVFFARSGRIDLQERGVYVSSGFIFETTQRISMKFSTDDPHL
jgi:hypothetical protein